LSPDTAYYIDGHYTVESARNQMADFVARNPTRKMVIVKHIEMHTYQIVD